MKNISVLLLFILTAHFSMAQNKSMQAKKLIEATHTKETTVKLVGLLIESYGKQHPAISKERLATIKNAIKYDAYLAEVENIFAANYTEKELIELTQKAVKLSPKLPPYKKEVEQQLYYAGKKFGAYVNGLLK